MAAESDALVLSLANVADLEDFMHELHGRVDDRDLSPGEDLTALAADLGVRVPEFLAGEPLVYEVHEDEDHRVDGRAIVLVRPSAQRSPVSRLKIICGRWGRVTVCLECGWIWCRVVIYGRF